MSLSLIINSLGLIQNTLFIKNIDFKTITKISLISVMVSGSVGIMMAYKGYGVWSLAVQSVTDQVTRVCLSWFFSSWRPTLVSVHQLQAVVFLWLKITGFRIIESDR